MRPIFSNNSFSAANAAIRLASLPALAGLALAGIQPAQAAETKVAACGVNSPAGEEWIAENGWRYGNANDPDPKKAKAAKKAAAAAFEAIVSKQSPWPNWFDPADSSLAVGTRFQMAMGPKQPTKMSKYGQSDSEPGGWGTFNNIKTAEDVREYLAVLPEFKPEIDRINTYVVTIPMPVQMGPVGPQVEKHGCKLLPGGWSQFNIMAGRPDRIKYLALESSRKLVDFK